MGIFPFAPKFKLAKVLGSHWFLRVFPAEKIWDQEHTQVRVASRTPSEKFSYVSNKKN